MAILPYSNYGTLLAYYAGITPAPVYPTDYDTVAGIVNLDIPGVHSDAVEVTNHESDWREFISSMLTEIGEIKFKLAIDGTTISTYKTMVLAGIVDSWAIFMPLVSPGWVWEFQGIATKFKVGDADAQNPDAVFAELTIRPTAGLTNSIYVAP